MSEPKTAAIRAAEELGSWWEGEVAKADAANPIAVPLYHYTDAAGLNGIFEQQQFWFTSAQHQNDPSELRHGLGIAFEELRQLAKANGDRVGVAVRIFCKMIEDVLSKPLPHEFFVASFSTDKDELGQWRGYGDDGRGFAIGLAPPMFERKVRPVVNPTDAIFTQPVIYDDATAREAPPGDEQSCGDHSSRDRERQH